MNIIARKPASPLDDTVEFIVVDRGQDFQYSHGRFVSASASTRSLAGGEWFWGHYFETREQAIAHFNSREGL